MNSAWRIEFEDAALKQLARLDRPIQARIIRYLEERVATKADPRRIGEAMTGDKAGLWRYRVGDYRIICRIEDQQLVVLVLGTGHRRDVYR